MGKLLPSVECQRDLSEILTSGGSRISPRRGRQLLRGGAPTYYLVNFSRKLHENKEILGPRGGRASPAPPLRSATVDISPYKGQWPAYLQSFLKHLSPQITCTISPSTFTLNTTFSQFFFRQKNIILPCYNTFVICASRIKK